MQRQKSVDCLRLLAIALITNSHFDGIYPEKLSFLRFGAIFGNCLFFLLSGYCLTHKSESFPRFIWRRGYRVYLPYLLWLPILLIIGKFPVEGMPSAKGWLSLLKVVFGWNAWYHFIPTIMLCYVGYYLFSWLNRKTKFNFYDAFFIVLAGQLIYFFFFFDFSYPVTGFLNPVSTLTYLQSMLLGGALKSNACPKKPVLCGAGALLAAVGYFIVHRYCREGYASISQLYVAVVFAYLISAFVISLEDRLPAWKVIPFISKMSLEIYLVQFPVIKVFTALPFPANFVLCATSIIGSAYALYLADNGVLKLLRKPFKKT